MDAKSDASSLFVYGALLREDTVRELLGRDVASAPAQLSNYERGRARYFFIRPSKGASVDGRLLLGLTAADFVILDAFEQVPRLYTRERLKVSDAAGAAVNCWVYLPSGWERAGSVR
ncbi:MAG: gamma-glutamylcyclotransferase family protein [Candidatus Binataceae bacterium]